MSSYDTILLGYLVFHFGIKDLAWLKKKTHRKLARIIRQLRK